MISYNQNGIIVRESNFYDVVAMHKNLRESDVLEVLASHNHTPEEALHSCIKDGGFSYTIEVTGQPVGIFGINPDTILGNRATIWFLATDGIDKIRRRFLMNSGKFIKIFLEHYSYLYNWVDSRNESSVEWLKFCGAKVEEAKPYGVEGKPFRYFYFEREGE